MDFTITVDDSLVPGIIATASLEGKNPEEVVNEYAAALATKTCQDLKVGPFYTGPTPPQFNSDGTPYSPDWTPPVVEPEVIEPEIVVEPEMEAELDVEPTPLTNDTTEPDGGEV
jgi:hypothetical protein